MSETTSTNFSVAQANSSDSAHAGYARFSHLREPASTRRVCFYKSGDPQFNGIKMVVSNRSFKTFDALLDTLSKKVPLPFGVRNISTPRGIHHITSVDELEDGKSYICSHHKKIRPINLERARKKPLVWQSSRPISARRLAVQLAQQKEVAPFQKKNTVVLGSSKKIIILKNGDPEFKHHFILNKKTKQSFDSFLDQVAEALQYPVSKLYSSDGRRILSIRALLLSSGTVVAAGRESFKYANYEPGKEILPVKLPGISSRVHPKLRSKQEMKTQLKSDEPSSTIPNSHEHSLLSEKTGNKSSNFVDFSYSPENEISLTEHWPHSGEELPVIAPGDNIEKSFHLNPDGTMTVEMKVRFKINEEETINWSTTVSRSDIQYYKSNMFTSSVEPAVEAVLASDHSLKAICKDNEHEESDEIKLPAKQDTPINTDKMYSSKQEKAPFYRPPTPGIRKARKSSTKIQRKSSEGSIEELQIVCNEIAESADNLSNCKQELILASEGSACQHNGANPGCILPNDNEELIPAKVRQETVKVLESTTMKLMQTDNIVVRPHSAGRHAQYKDNFKFKEIKRSVSASVSFSEPSALSKETSLELVSTQEGLLDLASSSNVVTQMIVVPLKKTSDEAGNIEGHFSTEEKKKKKKKSPSEQIKPKSLLQRHSHNSLKEEHFELERVEVPASPTTDKGYGTNALYKQVANTTCIEGNNESSSALEHMFCSQASTNTQQHEIHSEKKLKGNKKMAKVKPRSVGKNYELGSPQNKTSEYEKGKRKDSIKHNFKPENRNAEFTSTVITTNSALRTDNLGNYPLTELDMEQEKVVFRKAPKAIKKPQKAVKKSKSQKKKTKNNKITDHKSTSYLGSLDAEKMTNVHISQSSLETYVQTWLKNIFPNTVLPSFQLIPSSRKEDDVLYCSHGQEDKLDNGIITLEKDDVQGNRDSKQPCVNKEVNQQQPVSTEATVGKTLPMENAGSQNEGVLSVSIEPSKNLVEYFFQQYVVFENSIFPKGGKTDELAKSIEGNHILNTSQNRQSTDVAVQVESDTITKDTWEEKTESSVRDILIQQLKSYHSNDKKAKCRRLEKSFSVSDLPSENTSSPQLLLAWLIVLHLKQVIIE
uniref:Doublecortin domain-containing protein n=1 Tax=Xenopus tropicalis TaxID=8364 RepID=A0A803J7Y4_XENTR